MREFLLIKLNIHTACDNLPHTVTRRCYDLWLVMGLGKTCVPVGRAAPVSYSVNVGAVIVFYYGVCL